MVAIIVHCQQDTQHNSALLLAAAFGGTSLWILLHAAVSRSMMAFAWRFDPSG
jgi:hypothetical protein